LFLLLVGGVLLLDQMGFPLPDWLFSWHILLVALGIFIGLRHNFRGGAWIVMILIGGIYLIQDYYPDIHLRRFIWPGILIFVGLMIIVRPRRHHYNQDWGEEWGRDWGRGHWNFPDRWGRGRRNRPDRWGNTPAGDTGTGMGDSSSSTTGGTTTSFASSRESYSPDDYIDTTSIFGGVHKKIVSKNFKGGDITTMLGGTEIDLTQADFTGTVRLDVTQIMGGTKIIVPPHWEVRSEVTAVFAGFEDKRQQPAMTNPDKVLIIDGTSIFGGIELKNY
jgi:hypothetical protein